MKPRVLIVDDSLTVRMDLAEAFETAGFMSTLCSTVAEARSALSSESFALILLDLQLPDSHGIEFLQEIRGNPASSAIPVMLLSAEAEIQDRIRGLKTGADEYVGKPYDPSYVTSRARELLRKGDSENEDAKSKTVLIIDDSRTFREEMEATLRSFGHRVLTAASGEEGLRVAADQRPAVIVVDGILPGIDGATVIRRVRADAALRRTPCVLLTASEDRSTEILALDAGADDYVRKGEDVEVVLARISALMRAAGTPSAARHMASLLTAKRVLAVDDSPTYLQEIASQLRQDGYEVILAHSGNEAIELLSVQTVDCILLDLVMPGLSGQETCRRIKNSAAWRDIPLIMHSSLEEQEAMIEGINAGADDYIVKSGHTGVLRARLRAQLRRKQFEDENRSIREQLLQKELQVSAANAARALAEVRASFSEEVEEKNKELEAFSYSVSHDLRAPLRAIAGFSQIIADDHSGQLDPEGKILFEKIQKAATRMGCLIDDLLKFARTARSQLVRKHVDLSVLAQDVLHRLKNIDPERQVTTVIQPNLMADADQALLGVVLENLLGNAWKFTAKQANPRIEFGAQPNPSHTTYFVRDNGAGFNMQYANKLFSPFQRLHDDREFPGTGIGLATVKRIIQRHGGQIWAESQAGQGATFYFHLEAR